MMQQQKSAMALDDVLARLHEELEDGASADRLRDLVGQHPAFREELLAFAAEWLASEGSDLDDGVLVVSKTVSGHAELLRQFWAAASADDASPLPSTPAALRDVAERCRIDTAVLRKVVKGFVEAMTIPGKFVSFLAEATAVPTSQVWVFLTSPAIAAAGAADYFAPSGRKSGGKSSFADVIRKSDLSDEDKAFWLSHLDA